MSVCVFFTSCQQESVLPVKPALYEGVSGKGDVARPEAARLDAANEKFTDTRVEIKEVVSIAPTAKTGKAALKKRKDLL